jgi:DNA-binding MarR family transcriptional regulator
MNAIVFATKRVFQSAVRVANSELKLIALGLTAARFDMMFALTRRRDDKMDRQTLRQSELRRILGVSAPVVSRMLRSLDALGWITRRRPRHGDQRQRDVTLTDLGFARFRAAYGLLIHFAKRIVYRAICWGLHRDRQERFRNMAMLESYLSSLRGHFRDTARLYYAWGHPDD